MTSEALLVLAHQKGHEIIYAKLDEYPAFTIEDRGCHIVMSKRLSRTKEKECLAHELGHCEYGGFYNRYSKYDIKAKSEIRADKWAFMKLVPPGLVKEALQNGIVEPWDLAEAFDVSCEFMHRALSYYRQIAII